MPKITRSRESHSCRTCRRRRVRCDKVHPACSRCAASGLTCIYSDRNAPTPDSPAESQSNAVVERPPLRAPAERGHLEVGQNGFSYASSTFWGNSSKQLGGDLRTLLLSVSASRTPFSGAFEGVEPSNPKLGGFNNRTPVFNNNDDFSQTCPLCGGRLSLTCLLAMLPERDICDHMCNLFSVAVYPLMPILHQADFVEQYREFWAENVGRNWHIAGPGQVVRRDPTFVPLLFSMLFAATTIASSGAYSEEADDVFSGDLYFATMASLNLTGFPRRATHNSLAAYLFAQLQLSREEEFLDSPTFVSTSFRTALSMGLHRDGSAFGCSPIQIEVRRKLWWHVIHLDTMVASSSGLPPLFINENISNTGMVSIYEDPTADGELHRQTDRESKVDIRHIVARCRYYITKEMRRVITKHLECRLDNLPDIEQALEELDELRKEAWSTISTISEDRGSSPTAIATTRNSLQQYDRASKGKQTLQELEQEWSLDNPSSTVQTFRLYASTMIHLMLHKAYVMLLYPVMKTQDSSTWAAVRQTAIRHSHAYIRLFALLCTTPQFSYFSWMYPGTYQPLQPLSLILADLIGNPKSPEAETSIGLVDAIFALYQVGEGVTNPNSGASNSSSSRQRSSNTRRRHLSRAGQEAWSFLVSARRKALLQLGQDPHVLLPVSVDWAAYSQQPACVCGGRESPALQSKVLALPRPMLQRPSTAQQRPTTTTTTTQLQIQATEIPELGVFQGQSQPQIQPQQQQQQQHQHHHHQHHQQQQNQQQQPQQGFIFDPSAILPQAVFPDLSSISQWPDDTLSTEDMAFDWDQWDAVLGGAIGSLT